MEITLNCAQQQICACEAVIVASHATAAILKLQAQKLQSTLHMKEENQGQRGRATISLGVGDGAIITEDEFIKKFEVKKKAQEKKEKEGRKMVSQRIILLRNAQKEAWEVVYNEYEAEKAEYNRLCQELR